MPRLKIPTFVVNLLSVYSANAINGILGIVAVPLVVAALGSEGYGIYSIYVILAAYVALIDFGVTKHFTRLMSSASDRSAQTEYLQTALGWYLILSAALICLTPVFIIFVIAHLFPVPPDLRAAVNWIVILSAIEYVLAVPIMLTQAYTISNHEFKRYSNFLTLSGVMKYLLMFLAAWLFRSPAAVVLFLVSRRFLELVFIRHLLLIPPRAAWKPRIKLSELKHILVNSSMMSFAQFLQITTISLGAVFVNRHFGVAVLGNYRAAFDLASKIWFFSNGLGLIVFPKFSQLLSNPAARDALYKKMRLWLEKSWTGYLIISLLAVLSASWLLPKINLGNPQIITYFKLLIFGFCLNAHTNVSYEYLLADNRYRNAAVMMLAVLVTLIISYFAMLGSVGADAIGWAWIVSQSVYAFTADTLVMETPSGLASENGKTLCIKILVFTLTGLCLLAGLGIWPVHMLIPAPAALIIGGWVLFKDMDELKLFFN